MCFSDSLSTQQPSQRKEASLYKERGKTSANSSFSTLIKKAKWGGSPTLLKIVSEAALKPLTKGHLRSTREL